MRILVFIPCLTLGGAERQGLLVARHLKDRGHDVEVWGFPSPGGRATLVTELCRNGLRHEELSSWPQLDWRFSQYGVSLTYLLGCLGWHHRLRTIAVNMPQRKFDVVVPFTFWPSLLACLMREKLGAKKSFWNHRGGYDHAGVLYTPFLVTHVLRHRPEFMANSKAGARFLQDTFSLLPGEVTVIPNTYGADIEAGTANFSPVSVASSELSLIQVANFFPEKDYDTLLRALKMVNSQGTLCRLRFCGEFLSESDRSKFFARVDELGLQHCVVHHGATTREDIFRLLVDSDIGLLSSKSEGQPNSVIEYMAVGLPVVATKISGTDEIVGEENQKYLFDVGDAEGLARLINGLKESPALRAKIGRRNRKRITEHFSPEKVLPQWATLVERNM